MVDGCARGGLRWRYWCRAKGVRPWVFGLAAQAKEGWGGTGVGGHGSGRGLPEVLTLAGGDASGHGVCCHA